MFAIRYVVIGLVADAMAKGMRVRERERINERRQAKHWTHIYSSFLSLIEMFFQSHNFLISSLLLSLFKIATCPSFSWSFCTLFTPLSEKWNAEKKTHTHLDRVRKMWTNKLCIFCSFVFAVPFFALDVCLCDCLLEYLWIDFPCSYFVFAIFIFALKKYWIGLLCHANVNDEDVIYLRKYVSWLMHRSLIRNNILCHFATVYIVILVATLNVLHWNRGMTSKEGIVKWTQE